MKYKEGDILVLKKNIDITEFSFGEITKFLAGCKVKVTEIQYSELTPFATMKVALLDSEEYPSIIKTFYVNKFIIPEEFVDAQETYKANNSKLSALLKEFEEQY